jgi:hypothetical protein
MAGTTIIMSKLKHIVRLRSNGVPLQTIAKASGLSRNTVKKYLRLIEVKKLGHEDLLKMDDAVLDALLNDPEPQDDARYQSLASLFDYIEKELTRTGVNRWILWGNTGYYIRMDIATHSSVITTGNGKKRWQVAFTRHISRVKKCLSITPVKSSR